MPTKDGARTLCICTDGSGHVRDNVGTAGHGLLAGLALPDADRGPLDGVLGAERAGVLGVLGDLGLLDLLALGLLDTDVTRVCVVEEPEKPAWTASRFRWSFRRVS